jgi:tetratricopeptide (TPR) repeat protein
MNAQAAHFDKVLEQAKNYGDNTIVECSLGDVFMNLGKYKEAEAAYINAARMIPGRMYPEYLLSKLYYRTHQLGKVGEQARKVLSMQPKVPSRAAEQMKKEMGNLVRNNGYV